MRKPSEREWKFIALFSVIVPAGLLVTFRTTGLLHEPARPETIAVEATALNMSRPVVARSVGYLNIDRWVNNSHVNDLASVTLSTQVFSYHENYYPKEPDSLDFRMNGTVNLSQGFIHSIMLRFSQTDAQSYLSPLGPQEARIKLQNLQTRRMNEYGTSKSEAYYEAISPNRTKQASLSIIFQWKFSDENDMDHKITATMESTYFNGTAYQRVILPLHLTMMVDAGESFETAKILYWVNKINASLGERNDYEDFYAIWSWGTTKGNANVLLAPQSNADFDLYAYNPQKELVANSTIGAQGSYEHVKFTVDSSGWWYIRVTDPIKSGEQRTYILYIG